MRSAACDQAAIASLLAWGDYTGNLVYTACNAHCTGLDTVGFATRHRVPAAVVKRQCYTAPGQAGVSDLYVFCACFSAEMGSHQHNY